MTHTYNKRQLSLKISVTLLILFFTSVACAKSSSTYVRGATWKNYHTKSAFNQSINYKALDTVKLNAAIFHETNRRRVQYGLPTIKHHPVLEDAAQLNANIMVRDNYFAHKHPTNKRLRTPVDRNRVVGVTNPMPAENIAIAIAFTYTSKQNVYNRGNGNYSLTPRGKIIPPHTYAGLANSVLNQWMNSPGHKRNILSKKAVSLGCGTKFMWYNGFPAIMSVQNFQFYKPVKTSRRTTSNQPVAHRQNPPTRRPTTIQKQTRPQNTPVRRTKKSTKTVHKANETVITTKTRTVTYKNGVKHVEETTEVEVIPVKSHRPTKRKPIRTHCGSI